MATVSYTPIKRGIHRCGKGMIYDPKAGQCISLVQYRKKYGMLPREYQSA